MTTSLDDYAETGICALCSGPYEHWGNNPQPLLPKYESRCCDSCNQSRVIPERLRRHAEFLKGEGGVR